MSRRLDRRVPVWWLREPYCEYSLGAWIIILVVSGLLAWSILAIGGAFG